MKKQIIDLKNEPGERLHHGKSAAMLLRLISDILKDEPNKKFFILDYMKEFEEDVLTIRAQQMFADRAMFYIKQLDFKQFEKGNDNGSYWIKCNPYGLKKIKVDNVEIGFSLETNELIYINKYED